MIPVNCILCNPGHACMSCWSTQQCTNLPQLCWQSSASKLRVCSLVFLLTRRSPTHPATTLLPSLPLDPRRCIMGQQPRKFDAERGTILANLSEMLVRQIEERWAREAAKKVCMCCVLMCVWFKIGCKEGVCVLCADVVLVQDRCPPTESAHDPDPPCCPIVQQQVKHSTLDRS